MSIRGQSPDAWLARWRAGDCPVHGVGCAANDDVTDDGYKVAACTREGCIVVMALWPGKDEHHAKPGWIAGPEEIHASLAKAGQIEAEGPKPGRWAADARVSWPLEPE